MIGIIWQKQETFWECVRSAFIIGSTCPCWGRQLLSCFAFHLKLRLFFQSQHPWKHTMHQISEMTPFVLWICKFFKTWKKRCRLFLLTSYLVMLQGELQRESEDLWQEPFKAAAAWKPCADQRTQGYLGVFLSLIASCIETLELSACYVLINTALLLLRVLYSTLLHIMRFPDLQIYGVSKS